MAHPTHYRSFRRRTLM